MQTENFHVIPFPVIREVTEKWLSKGKDMTGVQYSKAHFNPRGEFTGRNDNLYVMYLVSSRVSHMETEASETGTGNSLHFVLMWVVVNLCSFPAGLMIKPPLELYITIYIHILMPT